MMSLTAAQRTLLAPWLPLNPAGSRGLLYEPTFNVVDARTLEMLRVEIRSTRARFRGTPSILIAPVRMRGDNGPVRPAGDGDGLSLWEWAWLVIDRDRELSPQDAFASLRSAFSAWNALDVAGVYVLASATLDEARTRARALGTLRAATWVEGMIDRGPWAQWLSSSSLRPPTKCGDAALDAALAGDWQRCADLTPARAASGYPRVIRVVSEPLMHRHVLRQICTHHLDKKPSVDVIQKSLAVLFSHWGKKPDDPWHAGVGVGSRLPLVALVAAIAGVEPLALLFEQRQRNRHLVEPPAPTFTLPKDVDDAYAAYEALLDEAIAHGGIFSRAPAIEEGLVLVPHEQPAAGHARLEFRVTATGATFALAPVDGETVAQLKVRVSAQAGPAAEFFALASNGAWLKLVDVVADAHRGGTIDVVWNTCSHGAPTHPLTGASQCFWDGGSTETAEH